MRVLVCGGRNYRDYDAVAKTLLEIKPSVVIEGGARGADYMASSWALENKVVSQSFKADWNALGKAAGPIRNQRMIDEGKPDLVVAFPGGSGTADMVRRAKKANIKVIEVTT